MSALPAAYVDIWPADGGSISLSSVNGAVLSVSTFKDIWDTNSGSFEILLPPGGPYGPNVTPQWCDIITPMSLTVIGLQRSAAGQPRANIVMVGVVTSIEQDTEWNFGAGVRRACRLTGQDFSYFFSQPSAYCDLLLRFTPAGLLGQGGNLSAHGISSGPPEQLATTFYNTIMAGSGGLMSGTKFQYQGNQIGFSSLVQPQFAQYPGLPITIPCAWNYLAIDGTWTDLFRELFPWPWYEFYIATQSGGQLGIGDVPFFPAAGPVVVARPTPIPKLVSPGNSLDMSLWNALPVVQPDSNAVMSLQTQYDLADVRNFYMLNPTYLNTLQGASNQETSPWAFLYAAWIDIGSIQRYGYKPSVHNIRWLADPVGNQAQQNASNPSAFGTMVGDLALVPVSFHEPAPLMSKGTAVLNLRPDIAPGVKFQYSPDKANTIWQAYVRSVSHQFVFGEQSTTTIGYCRGLPASVYNNNSLLLALVTGTGARIDGSYTTNPTTNGIEAFNSANASADLSSLSTAFTTPGAQ